MGERAGRKRARFVSWRLQSASGDATGGPRHIGVFRGRVRWFAKMTGAGYASGGRGPYRGGRARTPALGGHGMGGKCEWAGRAAPWAAAMLRWEHRPGKMRFAGSGVVMRGNQSRSRRPSRFRSAPRPSLPVNPRPAVVLY